MEMVYVGENVENELTNGKVYDLEFNEGRGIFYAEKDDAGRHHWFKHWFVLKNFVHPNNYRPKETCIFNPKCLNFELESGEIKKVELAKIVAIYFVGYILFSRPMKLIIVENNGNPLYSAKSKEILIRPTINNIKNLQYLHEIGMIEI
jgi:hypothetical protein